MWKTTSQPASVARKHLAVEDVALDDRRSIVAVERLDEAALAGREVVVDDDLGAVGQESLRHVAPDETGTAGDERPRHSGHCGAMREPSLVLRA